MDLGVGHCIAFDEHDLELVCSCGWRAHFSADDHPLVLKLKLNRAARRHLVCVPIGPALPRRPRPARTYRRDGRVWE